MAMNEEQTKNILSMLIKEFKEHNDQETLALLRECDFNIIDTRYDNWNYGTTFYTIFLNVEYSAFRNLSNENRKDIEGEIVKYAKPIFDDDNNIIENAVIQPKIEKYLDWDAISGFCSKKEFRALVDKEKEFLLLSGTGKLKIEETNNDENFKILRKKTVTLYKALLIEDPISFNSLWDWYHYYNKKELNTYQQRREALSSFYDPVFRVIDASDEEINVSSYSKTGFKKIDDSIQQLRNDLTNAHDRISYNQIGVRCRETLILLAKEVYDDTLHHPSDFPDKISDSDTKRMLDGYIQYNFSGSSNDEKRKYLKATNALADNLVHRSNATLFDAKLCFHATLSLIELIRIINEESKRAIFSNRK